MCPQVRITEEIGYNDVLHGISSCTSTSTPQYSQYTNSSSLPDSSNELIPQYGQKRMSFFVLSAVAICVLRESESSSSVYSQIRGGEPQLRSR